MCVRLPPPPCPTRYNGVGALTSSDVFATLTPTALQGLYPVTYMVREKGQWLVSVTDATGVDIIGSPFSLTVRWQPAHAPAHLEAFRYND
jgi:hypothetical protein